MSTSDEEMSSSALLKDSAEWKDVQPIYPTADEQSAVKIQASDAFVDAFAYFRAVLQNGEKSARVLSLIETCIQLNAGNYTLWQYRRLVLKALNSDLSKEMQFLNTIIEETPKNYQVWHHRRCIAEWLGAAARDDELAFTEYILGDEPKNYHAWQHRQWIVRRFNAPMQPELDFSLKLILEDPRNNSAFNYRYYILQINDKLEENLSVETNLARRIIEKMPHNESVWNYLSGILVNGLTSDAEVVAFVEDLYERTETDKRPAFLVSFLAQILIENIEKKREPEMNRDRAKQLYTELVQLDPVRTNYWNHQKLLIDNIYSNSTFSAA